MDQKYVALSEIIDASQSVVVLQADNPDGDSLASSLALEAILSEMGKTVYMICAVDMSAHLRHLPGWDRVQKEIPHTFDATIVVDNNTESLFEYYEKSNSFAWIKSKPVIVLDHHAESSGLSYADITIVSDAVATGELIYQLATDLDWPLPIDACEMLAVSIMSDSLGLITDATTPTSIRTIADLVERGVSLAKLDAERRKTMLKDPVLVPYKGELLQRVTFSTDGRIASVVVPWNEIEEYSPLYNPTMLVMDDMRMTKGVDVAVGYKVYKDGKVTAKIRSNYGKTVCADLAAYFGGGGHEYAAGFKLQEKTDLAQLKADVESHAGKLLDELGENAS